LKIHVADLKITLRVCSGYKWVRVDTNGGFL
jgi:hypothetical protein